MSREVKAVGIIFLILVPIILASVQDNTLHARNLVFDGVVESIEWESSNHGLPRYVLIDKIGGGKILSHGSIALDKSDVQVGDHIVKEVGTNYCLVNGDKVLFSRYLGGEGVFEIFRHVF